MFSLNKLQKRISHKNKKTKVGRGIGTGHGGHTSTRGQKGQKSRTGGKVPLYFEGGQLPLVKRLPHLRGFTNPNSKNIAVFKTSTLNKITAKNLVPSDLVKEGYLKELPKDGVKILLNEKVSEKYTLKGFKYSKSAKSAIEKAGGKAE